MFSWSKSEAIVLPITLLIVIALALGVIFATRNKSEKIKLIPLMFISVLLLVLEVAKQAITLANGYTFWAIPLHFCSLFLYFFPIASFFKGKVGHFGKVMSVVCSVYFFIIFYSNPSSVIGNACSHIFLSFHTAHTFIYHHLITLFFIILLGSKLYTPKKIDYAHATLGILLYCVVAIPAAHLCKENFCNILQNEIPILESIRTSCGQIAYTLVMMLLGVGGVCLIVAAFRLLQYILKKHKKKTDFQIIMSVLKNKD